MRNELPTTDPSSLRNGAVSGEFLDLDGERYYAIRNVDRMAPFFMSIISSADHWLFISSTGGMTAGRVSPETALFPYMPVDRIQESAPHTGSKTIIRVLGKEAANWEPFNREHDGQFHFSRSLYKNVLGNKICFEETNHDLQLSFRYSWETSDEFGFIRRSELRNLSNAAARVEILDGLQNILPAGTPGTAQATASNLVDAYKWTELDPPSGLAIFALYSAISDRAEPSESLRANTVFHLGLEQARLLISSEQVDNFRRHESVVPEEHKRGIRGAYLVNAKLQLDGRDSAAWLIVADVERSQANVAELRRRLSDPTGIRAAIETSVNLGSDALARIVASADGFQLTAEENVTAHHYANVLFNVLRGGIFDDQYTISSADLVKTIGHFNNVVLARNRVLLQDLPKRIDIRTLRQIASDSGDPQLERLCFEYLPITFGRRHGDPSRPWNRFSIRLKDANGDPLLSYEGNWRDIFQNWEALAFSYPDFIENIIAKFVNASTIDGYNPYRITKKGIDWETEEPDDPWSYIGYWGDHQIIYLLKLLELSEHFHPARLSALLRKPIFSYANVPYRIKAFDAILDDPKRTVEYDHELAQRIAEDVECLGADGKLLLHDDGQVYQVNLLEKLLVPLLAKLGNLVLDGGIWLNTQRPEWNDANNALVGHGLSMVTLFYLRRYLCFLQELLSGESGTFDISTDVHRWLRETNAGLKHAATKLPEGPVDPSQRMALLRILGEAASAYRVEIYRKAAFSGTETLSIASVLELLENALTVIDHSIRANVGRDGLFHAYNVLDIRKEGLEIDRLYAMLEGQVAALSAGALQPDEVASLLDALFRSDIYRTDQKSFMLYPDRPLPRFMQKNRLPEAGVLAIELLATMHEAGDTRITVRDPDGVFRFNADFRNVADLETQLDGLKAEYPHAVERDRGALLALYEEVFNHRSFTGRSGGMFGFEGLGCIYWHMVSKLLLAVQENFFAALDAGSSREIIQTLGRLYYRVRDGIGFNKTPAEYGAFPTDPYSHTPKHAGAQQPGMTGQVKEEVLTRFGELGVRVRDGKVRFDPRLLRKSELLREPAELEYLDVNGAWQRLHVAANSLAFTWCQVPIVYSLGTSDDGQLTLTRADGSMEICMRGELDTRPSLELFQRSGVIRRVDLKVAPQSLLVV